MNDEVFGLKGQTLYDLKGSDVYKLNGDVNTPPPKGGGFRLRLEAGLIDPSGR